ncbi:YwdK [Stigmatella aurantiaca DW4/3-1]|nr:YwdK [Stigmatella aurantiaca DW4/3-1]
MRMWIVLGAANAFLSVAAGAFGAHALKARLSQDLLAVFETGARYHMYHALGLLAVGLVAQARPSPLFTGAGWAMLAGIVLFSGSLYALALSGIRGLGAITPLGGVSFLAGWALLALGAWRQTG